MRTIPNEELARLGHDPAFKRLKIVADEREAVFFTGLVRQFKTKDTRPDYEDLQWFRGFFAGMKFLLDNPTLEAKALEKELAKERTDR